MATTAPCSRPTRCYQNRSTRSCCGPTRPPSPRRPHPAPRRGGPKTFRRLEIPESQGDWGIYRRAMAPGRPIVITLHTWSSTARQRAFSLYQQAQASDWNYFRPDLGGPNDNPDTCCSPLLLERLERAITFAIQLSGGRRDDVHIVGPSGGGYTALCYFMTTQEPVASVHAWVPITDLTAWYDESIARGTGFDQDILACTGSGATLDVDEALRRSPLHIARSAASTSIPLQLYAGIRDGHEGSVPVTHTLRMFDRLALEAGDAPIAPTIYDGCRSSATRQKLRDPQHLPQQDG